MRRVDSADSPPEDAAPPTGDDHSVDRLLAAVLPFHRLEDALRGLASAWHDRLRPDCVIVGAADVETSLVTAAIHDGAGPRLVSLHADDRRITDADSLRRVLTQCIAGQPADWIPLETSGHLIGGVLIGRSAEAGVPPVPTCWVSATTRLVAHASALEDQLQRDKLSALSELAAGAGHEINNPLGSILIGSERLLREEIDPERRRLLATLGGQAVRIRDMIGDLMLFANPPQPQPSDLDLANEVRTVAARFADACRARDIRLELTANEPVPIHADPTQLAVVISELLRNAVNAVPDGGHISIKAAASDDRQLAILTISNNGPALTEHEQAHLFDPFFSGRAAGRGLGFGLSKAWRIVTQHGGRIDVDSSEDSTCFSTRWPAAAPKEDERA